MAVSKTFHGARAVLSINGKVVGVFSQCSGNIRLGVEPTSTLGRFTAGELVYTNADPVTVSVSGYRVIGNGPHGTPAMPKIKDLLDADDITLSISDRATGETMFTLLEAKCPSANFSVAHRQLSDMSLEFIGIRSEDESGPDGETAGAVEFG